MAKSYQITPDRMNPSDGLQVAVMSEGHENFILSRTHTVTGPRGLPQAL